MDCMDIGGGKVGTILIDEFSTGIEGKGPGTMPACTAGVKDTDGGMGVLASKL
jgi:hypothetical protein